MKNLISEFCPNNNEKDIQLLKLVPLNLTSIHSPTTLLGTPDNLLVNTNI